MPAKPYILRARHVAPIASPTIADGAVRVEHRIVEVAPFASIDRAGARVVDLGEVVLLPGLVNAHTHLELSDLSPGERPASFGEWVIRNMKVRAALGDRYAATVTAATRAGATECLRHGVTTVGDISRDVALTRPALAWGPLRVVSFGEVLALAQRRTLLHERLAVAIDPAHASDFLRVGVSPHAPYTVEAAGYCACIAASDRRRMPICTHLAETLDEREFLATHGGSLRAIYDWLGTWDGDVSPEPDGPIAMAARVGLLDRPALLAHVNYASDDELNAIARGPASVAYCPRTHAYFGHPPHRWREMLARGINVCVATDSRASSPDLNVVEDLRLVRRLAPEADARLLWSMVTTRGAAALERDDVGAIAVGRRADFVAFPSEGNDPLGALLDGPAIAKSVWVDGVRV